MSDAIATIGEHRGVALHDHQSPERLVVVRRAIDDVFAMTDDPKDLLSVASNPRWPPESRLLAAAMLEAKQGIAADKREIRPDIDMRFVRACVAGVGSRTWRDPVRYASLLDYSSYGADRSKEPVRRETPLPGK
ncbi:hypothetical protein [Tardiphaga robiniae]|uniref:hypothetical protein n=1 Tax=Tardiphaga robiniae TaxID=943830 RepID=UPI0015863927|nr:hypothetical protein [Tardiphaga robiniae]NUU44552.1 hypothetical protein [Tardiphaga robiniae]